MLQAGEVNKDWRELVRQAASYARAMFNAVPLRAFALVIGVNHQHAELRFLIFHRGGLTTNTPLKLNKTSDLMLVQKIMMSVLLWQTPLDAGLPSFTDAHDFLLPLPRSVSPVLGKIEHIHYATCAVRSRATWVAHLKVYEGSTIGSAVEVAQPTHTFRRSARSKKKAQAGVLPPSSPAPGQCLFFVQSTELELKYTQTADLPRLASRGKTPRSAPADSSSRSRKLHVLSAGRHP